MRKRALPVLALLAGCIPRAEPPPARYAPPPPAEEQYAPAPASTRARTDAEATREANRRSLESEPERVDVPPSEPADQEEPTPTSEAADRGEPAPPPARPAWDARPVAADAAAIPDGTATVRPGETLALVAARTGASAGAIARANDLPPGAQLRAGQRLLIPGGRYQVVRAGEAGIAIARAYGVPWAQIVAANGLAEPFTLHVGERVLIPGPAAASTDAAQRAAAFTLDVDDILTGGEPALAANEAPVRPVATPARVLPPSAQVVAPARLRGGFEWPVEGRLIARFGPGGAGERNDGVGIAAPLRTPIHAAADGVVAYAGTGIARLGGIVIVRHGDGWTTVYGHASRLLVTRGESVRRGQTIALSGQTGDAVVGVVHFELRRGRTPVDPATQLPALGG